MRLYVLDCGILDISREGVERYHVSAGSSRHPARRARVHVEAEQRARRAALFSALEKSRWIPLDRDEYDVFGDGKAVIKAAPGHTPGHQVLVLTLAPVGKVMIAGDVARGDRDVSGQDEGHDLDRARVGADCEAEEAAAVL